MPSSEKANQRNELKTRLEELHNQLIKSSHISAADRDMLGKMVVGVLQLEDVRSKQVQQDAPEAAGDTIGDQGLRDTLEQKSLEYEAQHPKLAFTLRQILDILARMGI
ncbi:DUF4404 family protein [SAR92 clade bacterium H455]|uniref:DUF4404 family protein n=1 Tax=SAR92 clade bacterium H455 TaxID=2974818 RepID=A0ABY5TM23_9GAMM|nr:DUF4404 family protein [SAR92 clade bacterium H455]